MKPIGNRFTDELDALGRIIAVVRAYRDPMTDHSPLANSEAMNAYLKGHLPVEDWKFWEQVRMREQELLPVAKAEDQ